MIKDSIVRARQHLIVQGFALHSCPAAVCMLLVERSLLEAPDLAWAIEFGTNDQVWTARLASGDDSPLFSAMRKAALLATSGTRQALMHTQGGLLLSAMHPADVRDARLKIESAVAMGLAPPEDRLSAFPDEFILREARRRGLAQRQ